MAKPVYHIGDALAPLWRHLMAVPAENMQPQQITGFIQAIKDQGSDAATIRRLAAEHFGTFGSDADDIVRRIIKFSQSASSGADDAAFLSLADITKQGGDGFLIPEIDRVYKRWKKNNPNGTPALWITEKISTRQNHRHRQMLETLLGPALRQARPPRSGQAASGWRVRPRIEKVAGPNAVEDIVALVSNVDDLDDAVAALYAKRGMNDPPSLDDTMQSVRDYLGYFGTTYNRLRNANPNTLGGTFDRDTVTYMTKGRNLHPDEFLHRVLDGYEVLNVAARGQGLLNITDLSNFAVGGAECVQFALTGRGGRNTHGYVFELAIIIERTIGDASDIGHPFAKHIQVQLPKASDPTKFADGPDMVEVFGELGSYVAKYVQVKSYQSTTDLIGGRSEVLRQTGSDLRRTWAGMTAAEKASLGGALNVRLRQTDAFIPDVDATVSSEKIWAFDSDRLVAGYPKPVTQADEIALDAARAVEEGRITAFADRYNGWLTQDSVLDQAGFDELLGSFNRSFGRTSLNAETVLKTMWDAKPTMSMQELALARLIMDNKGAVDPDLLARLLHADTPKPQFKVEFHRPVAQPHRVALAQTQPAASAVPAN